MFFLIPVGVEGHEVRVPVVCIGIVAACVLLFFGTWVLPSNAEGVESTAMREMIREWEEHPYLELPGFFPEEQKFQISAYRAQWLQSHQAPGADVVEAEQRSFTVRFEQAFEKAQQTPMRRLALVPSRGFFQWGLLTHMFIHFGWLHLIGNLLFFYMCGPLLEDTWGRKIFGGFYLLGGFFAAAAHFVIDRHSTVPMGGASGAIAACMGAFAIRFASRKVSMGYLIFAGIRVFRGVWLWPAWVCGFLWFGTEVFSAVMSGGKASGVAVMAHVGGFAFGATVAFGMKAIGLEKSLIPSVEQHTGPLTVSLLKEVEDARALVQAGDRAGARAKYESAAKAHPDDADVQLGLVALDLAENARPAAIARLDRTLSGLLRKKEELRAISGLWEVWTSLQPGELKPALAFALAKTSEEAGDQAQGLAEPLFVRGGDAGGLMGAKSLIRAAELQLARFDETAAAATLDTLLARTDAGPELLAKARALRPPLRKEISLPEEPPASRPPPRMVPCTLLAVTDEGLTLQSRTGDQNALSFRQILGVAAGVVPVEKRGVLLVDLILSWGDASTAAVSIRLDSDTSAMSKLFPGNSAAEVYGRFFKHLLEATGATALPDASALATGKFPRYPSTEARDAAIFPGVA